MYKRQELQSGANSRKVAQQEAEDRLTRMKVLAGTVPVHGPGIKITIDDPDEKVTSDMMLDAVEEMRDAGAEAMVLNNKVRIVADTWFAALSLIHISEPTRLMCLSRMPSSA